MTKTRKQRDLEEMAARYSEAAARLGDRFICHCGASRDTFDDVCPEDLATVCDGFVSLELAVYPDGRTVEGIATPEQIDRCRRRIGS